MMRQRRRTSLARATLGLVLAAPLALARVGAAADPREGAADAAADEAATEGEAVPDRDADALFATADDEWVVSATRIEGGGAAKPFQSVVLDAPRLDAGLSPTVSDALRFVPGLHLVQEGAQGGRAQLALRGLDPNHVVVLIDGVRVNDPTNSRGGSFDPTTLALVDVERIEVVRGPLSSIHGADALAGVVQIVTRGVDPDAPYAARARSRIGRFHAAELAAQASGGVAGFAGLSLGAAVNTSRDPHSDGGYDAANLHAKLRIPIGERFKVESFARFHEGSARGFPESSGGNELAVLRAMEDRNAREVSGGAVVSAVLVPERANLRLQGSYASRREDLQSPGIVPVVGATFVPPSRAGDEYDRYDLSLVGDGELPGLPIPLLDEGPRVVVGASYFKEDGESDTSLDFGGGFTRFPFFKKRRTASGFGELEQPIGRHVVLSGSLRYDATSQARDRFSPAVGVVGEIPGTTFSVFGRYGQGFRRPSFYALGNPLVGNPQLPDERSRGWEAGVRWRRRDGRAGAQLGYFDLTVRDLHDFDAQIFQIVARGRLLSRGVEAQFDWQPAKRLELVASGSFNPTGFTGTSRPTLNRPRWRGFAELHYRPFANWDFLVRGLLVGPVRASAAAIGGQIVTLAGYERIDLRAAWTARPGIDLFFEIENVTDRTRREAVGFESGGIAPRIGVSVYR